jgi:hypothetical protein
MGWEMGGMKGPVQVDKPLQTSFVKVSEIKWDRGLKIGLHGEKAVGKTYFACTCPKPVYILDSEYGAYPVARQFGDAEIYIMNTAILDPQKDDFNPDKCLKAVEDAITQLKEMKKGTVVLDSATDIYMWLQKWLDDVAEVRIKKTGDVMRTEWAKVNERYRALMLRLIASPITLVVTAHDRSQFDSSGHELPSKAAHWQPKTDYWLDVIIHMWRDKATQPPAFKATVEKCRWKDMYNTTLTNPTHQLLTEQLGKELGIRFGTPP